MAYYTCPKWFEYNSWLISEHSAALQLLLYVLQSAYNEAIQCSKQATQLYNEGD